MGKDRDGCFAKLRAVNIRPVANDREGYFSITTILQVTVLTNAVVYDEQPWEVVVDGNPG